MERVKGIEPSFQAWEAHVLPLNHTRFRSAPFSYPLTRWFAMMELAGMLANWRRGPEGAGHGSFTASAGPRGCARSGWAG